MVRENEVPAELIQYLENRRAAERDALERFEKQNIYCTLPVRAVKMKILRGSIDNEKFCTVIIPAVDVYTKGKAVLKDGFLKRDNLNFYVSGTRKAFPYGHVYTNSGNLCLGSIFVPSAVPCRSVGMPLETLFLHNDRNLSHGNSHLNIDKKQEDEIFHIMDENKIRLCELSKGVNHKTDIIASDEIWNLSADVAEQKALPKALDIMAEVYTIIFRNEETMNNPETEEG